MSDELFILATIQAPINVPRMLNSTQIRAPSGAAIIQQHPANVQIQSHPPALHPVSQNTFAPGGAQVSSAHLIRICLTSDYRQTDICVEIPLLIDSVNLDSRSKPTCCSFGSSYSSN